MAEEEDTSRVGRLRRSLLQLNLFETDANDERTLQIQRWSTRVYICAMILCIGSLSVQHGLHVEQLIVETKNPSLDSYLYLRNLYTDVNCPCSQISVEYESFVSLQPMFHPICSSEFISQTWIEMLVDEMTPFRYPGDFRAVASTQFQTLRELCQFSQSNMDRNIKSFYGREFISGALFNEDLWRIENKAFIDEFSQNSFTNVKQKISFIRSFIIYNFLFSGIQTANGLGVDLVDDMKAIFLFSNLYRPSEDDAFCACDDGSKCYFPSSFYNADKVDNFGFIAYWILESELSVTLEHWFTGCWALESLYLSSLNESFLYRQTELDLITAHFNWPVNAKIPMPLNLTNRSTGMLNDLIGTSFVDDMITQLNYSAYFQQCQPESCFHSVKKYASVLYIITSLLAISGGLSVVLQSVIPHIVTFIFKRLRRQVRIAVTQGEFRWILLCCFERRCLMFIEVQRITWRERIQTMVGDTRRLLVELNLFQSSTKRQPSDIKQQRWTTRIYILLLVIGTIIFTFYATFIIQKRTIKINNPTLGQTLDLQMQAEWNSSLQCPCTHIEIPFGELVQLQPFYHQVCSSDFVKESWLYHVRALFQVDADLTMSILDFRHSYQLFNLLSDLCQLINETVRSSLDEFEDTQLVTGNLLSVNVFEHQLNTSIQKFQTDLTNMFLRFFRLTRNISYINQYLTIFNSGPFDVIDDYTRSFTIRNYFTTNETSSYTCSCANDINCKSQLGLYNGKYRTYPKSLVPGLYQACFALEALLQSTVECFYDNQTCLTDITNFYNVDWFPNFIRLNSTANSRFSMTSTMGVVLSELFIEYWDQSLNYSSYFNQCQPASCSYEVLRRNNLLDIATTVLGLVGGLSASLKILIPFIASICAGLLQRRQRQQTDNEQPSILVRLMHILRCIKNWFEQLNSFDNPKKTTGNDVQKQRRSTYIYLLLLCVALAILSMYNSLAYFPNQFVVSTPSLEQYKQLEQQYGVDAVDCSCSQVSITYASFIDFDYRFHPVCTSDFVSNAYLQQLFRVYSAPSTTHAAGNAFTLVGTAFAHFQALRTLCDLTMDTFKDARQQHLTSSIISASMIGPSRFEQQMNASLNRFDATLPDEFLSSLQLIRGMAQSNAFVSLYSTNLYPVVNNWLVEANVYMQPQYYGNCSCLTSAFCTQPSDPFIPGYLVGCTPFEALLQSSIECLYDSICIDNFRTHLGLSEPSPEPIRINETRFDQRSTVETMMTNMLIETCSSNISYRQFFEQCRPLSCTITVIERNNLITVIAVLFGLYGGLRLSLKIVVLILISFIYKVIRRRQAKRRIQVQPTRSNCF